MSKIIYKLNLAVIIIACLTLGLAPFKPPHIWEKLNMLMSGTLVQPADIFDLLMHGAPWVLLALKVVATLLGRKS